MDADADGNYTLTLPFVTAMMEEFKNQKLVHRRFAMEILLAAQRIFKALPSLVDVEVR